MALHWRPVGPEPAQTYWVRRAVVLATVLLPVVLLLQLLGGGDEDRLAQQGRSAAAPTAAPSPLLTPGPSADPSATPDPGPSGPPCADEALDVTAGPAEDAYAVGDQPRLELRITNTGATACVRDLGQAAVELQVVSGSDRIWSSDDCAPGGESDVVVLEPGQEQTSTVTWPGTRSRPGCTGDDETAEAGTYRVVGRVGDRLEQGSQFVLQ